MRVYIAGPISGLPELPFAEKEARFYRAAEYLRSQGHHVVVPMEIECDTCPGGCNPGGHVGQGGEVTHSWECFMRHDLKVLLECDAIALLPEWQVSRGARLEVDVADGIGLREIFLDSDGLPLP